MDTPVAALDKVQTETATGIKGMRLWIKGKSVELFAQEMRQLAAHLYAEADKLDPPAAPAVPEAPSTARVYAALKALENLTHEPSQNPNFDAESVAAWSEARAILAEPTP